MRRIDSLLAIRHPLWSVGMQVVDLLRHGLRPWFPIVYGVVDRRDLLRHGGFAYLAVIYGVVDTASRAIGPTLDA